MRRATIAVFAVLAIGLFVAGCTQTKPGAATTVASGASSTSSQSSTTTLASTTTTTEALTTTTSIKSGYEWIYGEMVDFNGVAITAEAPITDDTPRHLSEGKVGWAALITIVNERSEPIDYSPIHYRVVDTEGFNYKYAITLSSMPELGHDSLAPGQRVKGYVSFELPPSAVPAQVIYEERDSGQKWLAIWRQ